jgi:hypothetical protein
MLRAKHMGGGMTRNPITRRHCVVSGLAMATAHAAAPGRAEGGNPETEAELIELLTSEVEGGVPLTAPRDPRVTQAMTEWVHGKAVDQPEWIDGEASLDLGHLGEPISTQEFTFNSDRLRRLAELNAFALPQQLPARGPAILFGLRGCELQSPPGTFAAALRLREALPNHVLRRCIIGIWRPGDNRLAAFPASTVPNAAYMWAQVKLTAVGLNVCNLLPTGLHRYRVGLHNSKSKSAVPAAMVQAAPAAIVRSYDDMRFTDADPVSEPQVVGDNVHPAFYEGRRDPPFFSSAGCQVISGSYADGHATGMWLKFSQMLGLVDDDGKPFFTAGMKTARDDDEYVYMLLTGREARLVAASSDQNLKRLRFGSSGPAAVAIRRRLAAINGEPTLQQGAVLDGKAMYAFADWHEGKWPGRRSNVIAPQMAAALGITL